jgi:cytochrome b561
VNPIPEKYSNFAIFIHWLMVILIFVMFGLGWYMVDLPKGSDERSWFFALHKSIGLTLAILVIIRLVWCTMHKPPALPDNIEQWKQKLANLTHNILYLLMFLQPVSGYISSSFSGYKTKFWGYPLPYWGWKDQVLNELFTVIHVASSITLIGFIILHILGAVSHMIGTDQAVMQRMLPGRGKK